MRADKILGRYILGKDIKSRNILRKVVKNTTKTNANPILISHDKWSCNLPGKRRKKERKISKEEKEQQQRKKERRKEMNKRL